MSEHKVAGVVDVTQTCDVPVRIETEGEFTDTINVSTLFSGGLTSSGVFDLGGIQATHFGKLLDSLPIPASLIDMAGTVLFVNQACSKISPEYKSIEGGPFSNLFPDSASIRKASSLIQRLFSTRKQQTTEGELRIVDAIIWGRMNFRSLRIASERLVLLMVEDLTIEREQLLLTQQHRRELLDTNQQLRKEIDHRVRAEENLKSSLDKLETVLDQTAVALASAVEKRDPYTAGHQKRVAKLGCAIAIEMGFSRDLVRAVRVSGLLHDIGKICVPAEILGKPGELTEHEFAIIKTHCQAGFDILKGIEFPWPVAQVVMQHHERMDGSGYPAGLLGKDILIQARILAVADVLESVASHRPYRPSLGTSKAIEEILANKGKLYDSRVVNACMRVLERGFTFENGLISQEPALVTIQ